MWGRISNINCKIVPKNFWWFVLKKAIVLILMVSTGGSFAVSKRGQMVLVYNWWPRRRWLVARWWQTEMPIWAQKRSPENYSCRIARYITIKLTLQKIIYRITKHTNVQISLHTLLDRVPRRAGMKYANFQEKVFAKISGKMFQTFHYSYVTTMKNSGFSSEISAKIFSWKLAYKVSRFTYTKKGPQHKSM